MRIEISFDHDAFIRQASDAIDRHVQPGMQNVVDYLGAVSRKRLSEATARYFDKPIAFTQNAFAYQRQPPTQDAVETLVYVLPERARYLGIEVIGGTRRPGDYGTTKGGSLQPGRDAGDLIDESGNLPQGFVSDELDDGARWAQIGPKRLTALVLPGRGQLGERSRILAVIVPEVEYRPRFPFYDIVTQAVFDNLANAVGKFGRG